MALERASLDGSLVPSYGFREATGYSGKHHQRGVKVSSIVEENGLPLSVVFAPGNIHDLELAVATIGKVRIGKQTRPGIILADKGYDSAGFRRILRLRGIKTNIPERKYARRNCRADQCLVEEFSQAPFPV